MHITAYCPSCRSRYQLDAGLRGQRIRCPNPVCREIFEVHEAEPEEARPSPTDGNPPAPPREGEQGQPSRPQRQADNPTSTVTTGSVGDLVPFLEAEVVHEVPPPVPSAEAPPTPIEVHEARHWQPETEDDSKPIPVDPSLLPPPIEVENLVPLEPDEEARATPVQEAASWHMPPPVRNPDALHTRPTEAETPPPAERAETPAEPRRTRKSKTLPALPAPMPEEAPPSWQTAPPVRRSPSQSAIEPSPLATSSPSEVVQPQRVSPETSYDTTTAPSGTSRRALWIIGAMVVVAGFLIATVTVVTLNAYVRTEGNLYSQAKREYDESRYGSAAKTFENLATDFPNSENRALYGMLAELSHVRDQVYTAQADPDEAHAAAGRFLAAYNSSPSLKGYRPDLWQTLGKLAEQLAVLAKQQRSLATLAKAKETRDQSRRFKPSDRDDPDESGKQIALAEAEIAYWQKKQQMLARLNGWMQTPSVQAVKDARQLAKQQGLDKDAEINQGIAQLDTAVRLTVRYVANEPGAVPVAAEALDPSLLIVPAVIRPAKPAPSGKHAVFALARGVLYALDPNTGQPLWATRVGIDTANLPVLLPAAPPYPELLLALSADRHTIMALEPLTGKPAWQHRLSAPSLGRPVIVDRKAYVATYDGYVHEIETALGFVLGHFELGQHLTVGGVRQEGTPLLYFPGDSDYVYVLDMAARKCVAILHTGHPSGSLRSEPIVVDRMDPFARGEAGANAIPSYLILTQTSGLSHMKLRAFRLPIDNPDAPPEPPEPRIRGWSWFRPYHDGERLAFATDAGMVGLFGINQLRNEDTPLFPELPPPPEERKPRGSAPEAHLIRGQVVHVVENDFWILADGKLERQHFDPFRQQMIPVWETPLVLGSPVHAAQTDESGKTLFVVTQDLYRQIYLATAVAAEDGVVLWQRQLGLECAGDPVVLGREIVTVDRGGGLSIIDSSKNADLVGMRPDLVRQPELRGAAQRYRPALPGGALTVHLLPAPDGTGVYEVACPAAGGRLTVRRYPAGSAPDQPEIWERTIEEQIQLAGTPAIVGPNLLLPLADGTIRRVPLLAGHSEGGPNWRAARVDENARGHIVAVGPDDFLTTDGSRGLTHWRWPANDPMFQTVPENRIPTIELPARIVSAPVILPSPKGDSEWQVCVALADGTLARLRGLDLKLEQPLLPPSGQITAGPFRHGPYVGCVVDRRRLVWLDPKAGAHWEYRTPGEAIVGEPQLVGGLVVVADLSGRFIGLDPATGTPAGLGYTLKTSAAPAAAPAAFGTDAAFVPLTDGTVFVLARRHLQNPLASLRTLGP